MFKIDAGFVIWMVFSGATILLMLAGLRAPVSKNPTLKVTVDATPELQRVLDTPVQVVHTNAPSMEPAPVAQSEEGEAEVRHWCMLALNKLGYSKPTAKALADRAPAGLTLQEAVQWCLRNNNGTHK